MNHTLSVPFHLPHYDDDNETKKVFTFIALALVATTVSSLSTLVHIPHQVPAILFGLVIGGLTSSTSWVKVIPVDSSLLVCIYIPLVITKMMYTNDNYLVVKSIPQLLVIVIIGNALFIPGLAMLIKILQYQTVNYLNQFIVAVILTPNQCSQSPGIAAGIKNLETLIIGESLLSFVLCLTLYTICIGLYQKAITTYYHIFFVFVRYIGGAIPVGYLFGLVTSALLRQLYNDSHNAVCAVLATSFFVYNLCEDILFCNGCLALSITLYLLSQERKRLLPIVDTDIITCINVPYYFMTTMILVTYIVFIVNLSIPQLHVSVLIEAIVIYIIGNVLRLIVFLVLSPILSRIGYGFDFISLVTIFWAVHKGPLQLLLAIAMRDDELKLNIGQELRIYTFLYVLCSYMVNHTTLTLLLKRFGITSISNRRKANVTSSINVINETANRILATFKLNRVYSDANWVVINEQTELRNPFAEFALTQNALAKDSIVCHVCNGIVPLRLSKEEHNEILGDVTLRILKAQRVSFVKQVASGLLSKISIRILLQAVEVAMDSTDMHINIDYLFTRIDNKNQLMLAKTMKKILTIDSSIQIPKSGFRKVCYNITTSIVFELLIHFVTIIIIIIVIVRIAVNVGLDVEITLLVIDCLYIVALILECLLTALSYAHVSVPQHIRIFFKNHWNKFDFLMIQISISDVIISILVLVGVIQAKHKYYLKWLRLLSVIKLLRVFSRTYPLISAYMEHRKDMKLMRILEVGIAIILSTEDAMEILPSLTQQSNIRNVIQTKLLESRATTCERINLLGRLRPSLSTTLKTKQVLRSIYKFLHASVNELHTSGLIDEYEYQKLNNAISVKHKNIHNIKTLETIDPKSVFCEVPWLYEDAEIQDTIYNSMTIKLFNVGDVLCKSGDQSEGIYIIITGYFQMTYCPTEGILKSLQERGELPIKECLDYMRLDDVHFDYLSTGNRIGQLAFLTNRPFSCSIVSEAPTQAFVIPRATVESAMLLSPDPVIGLAARLWKDVLSGLGRKLLITTPNYRSASEEQIDYALNRAIVPNIGYYSIVSLTQVVEYVLLLEGIVVDLRTRETFTAPCAIPRHVTKLIMPKSSLVPFHQIGTKLMFFPNQNIDEYRMMQSVEVNSELLPNHNCVMLTERVRRQSKRFTEAQNVFDIRKAMSGALNKILTKELSSLPSKPLLGSRPGSKT